MNLISVLIFLSIGAIAGWVAGILMKGKSFGIIGNIVVGILGGIIGGYAFRQIGIFADTILGSLTSATVGAVALLYIVGFVKTFFISR